jgi:cytochrome c oxidase subunit 3
MEIPYNAQPRPDTGLYNAKVGIWLFLASEVMLFGAFFSSYILLRVGARPEDWPVHLLNVPIGTFNTAVLIISSVTVVLAWASLKMKRFDRFKIFQAITILCAVIFLGVKSFEYSEKFSHYEVWKTDGTRMTGHLEEKKNFLTLPKLKEQGVESIRFIPDLYHYSATPEEKAEAHKHAGDHHHEAIEIPVSEIRRFSAFVPAHGTYFATYFTMTALHGLHVLGGAIVMAWFFGPGSKMWHTEPDRFTNRIEVSGLFWHFVDLVWIFLFPVLYLL